jgi:hypothetical protein
LALNWPAKAEPTKQNRQSRTAKAEPTKQNRQRAFLGCLRLSVPDDSLVCIAAKLPFRVWWFSCPGADGRAESRVEVSTGKGSLGF